MQHININAYDTSDFGNFIASLYDDGGLPPFIVHDDEVDVQAHYIRTGAVAVLAEDETAACPVFGNWVTYYEFMGWLAYRQLSRGGNEFQLMVADVLGNADWSPETVQWINIIHGLAVVQNEYAVKFGHYPADLHKFIGACITFGAATVMLEDNY